MHGTKLAAATSSIASIMMIWSLACSNLSRGERNSSPASATSSLLETKDTGYLAFRLHMSNPFPSFILNRTPLARPVLG